MLHATTNFEGLVNAAAAPDIRLPDAQPLTLTRNFIWVVFFCVISLVTVPLAAAWTASILFS